MRKSTALLLALALFVIGIIAGYLSGAGAVISAPKWVEEDSGLLLVVTDFCGQEYVDVAEKPAHMYDELAYVIYRR